MTHESKRPRPLAQLSLLVLLVGMVSACRGASSGEQSSVRASDAGPASDEKIEAKIEAKIAAQTEAPVEAKINAVHAEEAAVVPDLEKADLPIVEQAPDAVVPGPEKADLPIAEQAAPDADPAQIDRGAPTDEEASSRAESIPAALLPKGCNAEHAENGVWDGEERFMLSCQKPRLKGWNKVGESDDYGAGSAFRTHIYRKDGWMLLWSEVCCSACDPDKLTGCEPHMAARLYPPSALRDCKHSPICAEEGLCRQRSGWCEAAED